MLVRFQSVFRWLFAGLAISILFAFALAAGIYLGWMRVGPNWAPWGIPDLNQAPGWFARLQLNTVSVDGNRCVQMLSRARLRHTRLLDRRFADGCRYTTVVRSQPPVPFRPALMATCSLTAALTWYERVVDDIASRTLRQRIVRIDHVGTYVCRNVNRDPDAMRSEHATANAIDITAFRLANGKVVSVTRDWGKATPEGKFLREAHEAACGLFNVVLGPDFNKAHATHFHLDLGSYRACR
jgi:hypothetical protein